MKPRVSESGEGAGVQQSAEIDAMRHLSLRGGNHMLRAIPVDGDKWVGMIEVQSPTDAALLTPAHATALRDWLDLMLAEHKPFSCPCGHGRGLHDEDGECFSCDVCAADPEGSQ